jgi:hypothetical protein
MAGKPHGGMARRAVASKPCRCFCRAGPCQSSDRAACPPYANSGLAFVLHCSHVLPVACTFACRFVCSHMMLPGLFCRAHAPHACPVANLACPVILWKRPLPCQCVCDVSQAGGLCKRVWLMGGGGSPTCNPICNRKAQCMREGKYSTCSKRCCKYCSQNIRQPPTP